jgi:hypothetical protein
MMPADYLPAIAGQAAMTAAMTTPLNSLYRHRRHH